MIKTEKKHWVNGYQTRGGGKFKTFAAVLKNYAIMITWGIGKPELTVYKLIK